jgi:hypothetical protein
MDAYRTIYLMPASEIKAVLEETREYGVQPY